MKRTISMCTDHDYYGRPIEVTTVELYCDETMTPAQIEIAERNQERRLQESMKRMPHHYWQPDKGEK